MKDLNSRAFRNKPCYVHNGELIDSFRKEEKLLKKEGLVYKQGTNTMPERVREQAERKAWAIRNGKDRA